MDGRSSAPIYEIPWREIVAVEHPMVIKNIDNGLKTFGNGKPFARILPFDDPGGSLPLYLRHNDPMCVPILSHSSSTSNILLKITVPKRTGKRKRGSQDPYQEIAPSLSSVETDSIHQSELCSHSRRDAAAQLSRSLQDNANVYQVEPVAGIGRTHRFRGLTDFHHSTSHSEFSIKFQELVLPGDAEKMREFKLDPRRGWKKNEDFMPPPLFTNEVLPFNWAYQQNAHVMTSVNKNTGETVMVNTAKSRKSALQYLPSDIKSIPLTSPHPSPTDEAVRMVLARVTEALNERPIWTRRALGNRIGHEKFPIPIIKALHHAVYQFKRGPFRDTLIKYGVDPRTDQKYCKYQTLFFKVTKEEEGPLKQWKDGRTALPLERNIVRTDTTTHIFDGKTFASDGKVWQLCDITDPILRHVIDNAQLRNQCEIMRDGYLSNGTMAKVQAIMRMMLIAIRARVPVSTLDFEATVKFPDVVEDNMKQSKRISVPLPEIRLSKEVVQEMASEGIDVSVLEHESIKKRGRKKRTMRISKKLAADKATAIQKNYVGENVIEMTYKNGEARPIQEQAVSTNDPGSSRHKSQAKQASTVSDEYITADGILTGARRETEDNEREIDDESEERESDVQDIESGSDREEEDEYDSDTTDIVDPSTYFKPASRPLPRS